MTINLSKTILLLQARIEFHLTTFIKTNPASREIIK